MRPLVASRWRVGSGRSLATIDRRARNADNPPEDPWPIDHAFDCKAYQPWSTHEAYVHTLVSGNDGQLIVSDMTRASSDVAAYAGDIVVEQPSQWFKDQGGSVLKLAIYAHGGLNSEEESIKRIRVLAPYFAANGVYPLFVTWKTGPGETLCDVMQDWARKVLGVDAEKAGGLLDALGDAKDRAIEAIGHVLGKGIWSEMRENAELGEKSDHSLNLLARNLAALSDALGNNGKRLELHLVGHSAGSILIGHLLDQMLKADPAANTSPTTMKRRTGCLHRVYPPTASRCRIWSRAPWTTDARCRCWECKGRSIRSTRKTTTNGLRRNFRPSGTGWRTGSPPRDIACSEFRCPRRMCAIPRREVRPRRRTVPSTTTSTR